MTPNRAIRGLLRAQTTPDQARRSTRRQARTAPTPVPCAERCSRAVRLWPCATAADHALDCLLAEYRRATDRRPTHHRTGSVCAIVFTQAARRVDAVPSGPASRWATSLASRSLSSASANAAVSPASLRAVRAERRARAAGRSELSATTGHPPGRCARATRLPARGKAYTAGHGSLRSVAHRGTPVDFCTAPAARRTSYRTCAALDADVIYG